ncbi:MAG: acetylglutamate kinase [Proteobacteria bacterium]|jgi:acetylglutamate kinase|nr:acetylglutamate kinase [Pseudomonadota bacterium]NCV23825.1 acetylglutamate kinase [Pseudomonadota bacterium]NCW79327.1 acetylglutamate kinase [Pelagibacteraceae bacterium]
MDFAEFWPSDAPSLSEAKNYIEKYQNKKIILKYGGQVMATDQLSKAFAQDAAVCKRVGAIPIVIHGGGPQIKEKLKQQNLESKFILGLRVTDEKVIKVVEEVLLNEINPDLVNTIKKYGVLSEPITVRNKNIIHIAKAINPELGFVGDPDQINVELLNSVINDNIVPVIAPMGLDATGQVYNINADTAAGIVANKMEAERLLLMTDVPGVNDKQGNLISKLTIEEAEALIANETITGGMIPKIRTCISAIRGGVKGVVIIDGRKPHAVLYELFSNQGAGTLIVQ